MSGAKGTVEAGIYSIATVLAEMLWQAVVAAAQVNLPPHRLLTDVASGR